MYLPNSLYERAPHYWLFIGMLLIIIGVYLGFQINSKFMIVGIGLGLLSCGWGVRILLRRARRAGEADVVSASSTAD